MPDAVQCPKLDFAFTGKCPHVNCLFWHKSEVEEATGCLKLDYKVQTGLEYTTVRNSKLLAMIAKSDDPQVQLAASRMLLHFALLLAHNFIEYTTPVTVLCRCGVNESACHGGNGICENKRQALDWLLQLFKPLTMLNNSLTKRELYYVLQVSLLQFRKANQLPKLIEEIVASKLSLSKRIV